MATKKKKDEDITKNEVEQFATNAAEKEEQKSKPTVKWHPVAKFEKNKNNNFFSKALKFLGF